MISTGNSNRFDNEGFIILGNDIETEHNAAVAAARQGARVVLGLRGEQRASAISTGEEISVVAAETTESGIKRLFDEALERLEDLSVLIHCLATPAVSAPSLAKISRDEWDCMMSVYLREPFLASQCAIQEFLATGKGGHIIFVLSAESDDTTSQAGYTVVQYALYAFIRSIAKEYGRRGIVCNAVTVRDENDSRHLRGSNAHHEAVIETILFLASNEASFVNGEMIPVTNSAPHGA